MREERESWKKRVADPGNDSEAKLAFRETQILGYWVLVVEQSQGTPVDHG
jgi:hypothetical protein